MPDEVSLTPREELNLRVLARAGGPSALATPSSNLPILGPSFAARVTVQFELIKRFRASFAAQIGVLSDEEMAKHFDGLGNPISNEGKFFALELRELVAKANETVWDEIALTPDRFRADDVAWGARTELTPEEVTLLSVGLEPTSTLIRAIDGSRPPGDGETDEAQFVFKRFVSVSQWVEEAYPGGKIPTAALATWFAKAGLPMASGFAAMIQRAAKSTTQPSEKSPQVPETPKADQPPVEEMAKAQKPDPREKMSMAKLICAMAIDGYGYDPSAARSPIPKEIQAVTDRLGISISNNTILAYLRLGAEQLSTDWKEAQLTNKVGAKRNKLKK